MALQFGKLFGVWRLEGCGLWRSEDYSVGVAAVMVVVKKKRTAKAVSFNVNVQHDHE